MITKYEILHKHNVTCFVIIIYFIMYIYHNIIYTCRVYQLHLFYGIRFYILMGTISDSVLLMCANIYTRYYMCVDSVLFGRNVC